MYVNRALKLSGVEWLGFDMDYTLALYHQEAMDRLSIDATVSKLIKRGYPEWLAELHYPLDFPIRGLLIDKQLGNVLKMNRFKIVRRGFHGLRELTREELRALYYDKKIRHKTARYHWIDTLYGLSEACMYAVVIEAFGQRKLKLRYGKLFTDIRECIDEAHRDGSILDPVMKDTAAFIERDPALAGTLHKFRSAGKKLFLLTNSRWAYTRCLLSYLLDDALDDYPSFQHYFDALIVSAKKPSFFQDSSPMMERRGDKLVKATLPFERGKIYEGGNLRELQKALGVTGNRVLYVGDHIYGDMLRSKKDSAWRTAMVIQELEAEVEAHQNSRDDVTKLTQLYDSRNELENELRHYQQRLKKASRKSRRNGAHAAEADAARFKQRIGVIRKQLKESDESSQQLQRQADQRFHPYWGSLLKEGGELSLFGAQVDEYACVYTSRVSNFLSYSPQQYFRSPHALMHHEL